MLETIKEILNFNLISFDKYHLSVLGLITIIGGFFLLRWILRIFARKINKLAFLHNRMDSGRQHSLVLICL